MILAKRCGGGLVTNDDLMRWIGDLPESWTPPIYIERRKRKGGNAIGGEGEIYDVVPRRGKGAP